MEPWLVPRGPDPSRRALVRPVSPDLSSGALVRLVGLWSVPGVLVCPAGPDSSSSCGALFRPVRP